MNTDYPGKPFKVSNKPSIGYSQPVRSSVDQTTITKKSIQDLGKAIEDAGEIRVDLNRPMSPIRKETEMYGVDETLDL